MFVTGPNVVKTVTHEEVTAEELGGAVTHASGAAWRILRARTKSTALRRSGISLRTCPPTTWTIPPRSQAPTTGSGATRARHDRPGEPEQAVRHQGGDPPVSSTGARFLRCMSITRRISSVGFARLDGRSVGIVANQPAVLAGVLDIDASRKGARFVRFCDAFNIPLVVFEDVPGFLPGTDQEWRGIITNGAKLLYAFCEATVPRLTVITRKAYGGAYDVMNSKHIRGDMNFAWPGAEIAVMGPKGAAEIIFRREIEAAPDREKALAREGAGIPGEIRQPVPCRGPRIYRRGDRAARKRGPSSSGRSRDSATRSTGTRKRNTGTSRCRPRSVRPEKPPLPDRAFRRRLPVGRR